jgi:hypothetical protein
MHTLPIQSTIVRQVKKFLNWFQSFFARPIHQDWTSTSATASYKLEEAPIHYEPEPIKPTKTYADQRQKSKRRRRRKPSKAMANLYHL